MQVFIIVIIILILLIFFMETKEMFPSNQLFEHKPSNDQDKYKNHDPIRFHSRMSSDLISKGISLEDKEKALVYPYLEKYTAYDYDYAIPQIANFNKRSALDKFRRDITGVDINRRTWPPHN